MTLRQAQDEREIAPDRSLAFWAKCGGADCGHCWPAGYYPAPLGDFARSVGKARCPKCGEAKALIAKQDAGVLREPST